MPDRYGQCIVSCGYRQRLVDKDAAIQVAHQQCQAIQLLFRTDRHLQLIRSRVGATQPEGQAVQFVPAIMRNDLVMVVFVFVL